MREILFRGKWTRNGKWIEGFYARIHDGKGNVSHRIYTGCAESDCGYFYPENFEVDPSTVGQFTGLCDKNDKKIFEGDVVDASDTWWYASGPAGHDSPIIPVEWSENNCGFNPFANYDCDCGVYIYAWRCEVIGNKWDNPALLEGKG